MDGIESKCRKQDIKETLRLWSEMKEGSELGKQYCMRFRMDMQVCHLFLCCDSFRL